MGFGEGLIDVVIRGLRFRTYETETIEGGDVTDVFEVVASLGVQLFKRTGASAFHQDPKGRDFFIGCGLLEVMLVLGLLIGVYYTSCHFLLSLLVHFFDLVIDRIDVRVDPTEIVLDLFRECRLEEVCKFCVRFEFELDIDELSFFLLIRDDFRQFLEGAGELLDDTKLCQSRLVFLHFA